MGIEITFDGALVTGGKAPHNAKFGKAENLDDAIAKARTAHANANGKPGDVNNEDVVIVQNGDNLWALWEKYGKEQGVSWDDFLQSNMHLKAPKTLDGGKAGGQKDWWLVHKGDVVFIPEDPATAAGADGKNSGRLMKVDGKWHFQMTNEKGDPTTKHELKVGDFINYDGVRYKIEKLDNEKDTVEAQPVDKDGKPIEGKPKETLNLNDISK